MERDVTGAKKKAKKRAPPASATHRYDKGETRRRLLDRSAELFAEQGPDSVSVRDICAAAGVNLAAIAYHFGGKDELYSAALRAAMERVAKQIRDESAPEEPDPLIRLRRHVLAFCRAFIGPASDPVCARLFMREMSAPSATLKDLVRDVVRPNFELVAGAIRALARDRIADEDVVLHVFSIVGQVLHYRNAAPITLRLLGWKGYPRGFAERAAAHIVAFSLRGIGRADLVSEERSS
jgi:TetR/AcrR family transcriptional regulator, regulator of cefoperazone and chloramphenicol sensitivity